MPPGCAPLHRVEGVSAVDDVSPAYDVAEHSGVHVAELAPLGQVQHDVGVPGGVNRGLAVTEMWVVAAGVVERDRVVDGDCRSGRCNPRRYVERGRVADVVAV